MTEPSKPFGDQFKAALRQLGKALAEFGEAMADLGRALESDGSGGSE